MSDPNGKQTPNETEEPKVHPRFTRGDTEFLSSDGTLFKVSLEALSYGSQVFADMLDLPKRPPVDQVDGQNGDADEHDQAVSHGHPESPIQMDVSSPVLLNFLAILMSPIGIVPDTSVEDTLTLHRLCHKYDCNDEVLDMVRNGLVAMSKNDFWTTMSGVSELNDRVAGKKMLEANDLGSLFRWDGIRKLQPSWAIRILSTAFTELGLACGYSPYNYSISPEVGHVFQPSKAIRFRRESGIWETFDKLDW